MGRNPGAASHLQKVQYGFDYKTEEYYNEMGATIGPDGMIRGNGWKYGMEGNAGNPDQAPTLEFDADFYKGAGDYNKPYNPKGNTMNASGTENFRGGFTWVGEAGPERVFLPRGSKIQTAQESRKGGDTFIFNIRADNIKELNDLIKIAESARVRTRMKG